MNQSDLIIWSPGITLRQIEHQVVNRALVYFKDNKAATARALGVDVRTLQRTLDDIEKDRKAEEDARLERQRQSAAFLERSRNGSYQGARPEGFASDVSDVPTPTHGINPPGYVPEKGKAPSKVPMPMPPPRLPDDPPADASSESTISTVKPGKKRA